MIKIYYLFIKWTDTPPLWKMIAVKLFYFYINAFIWQ